MNASYRSLHFNSGEVVEEISECSVAGLMLDPLVQIMGSNEHLWGYKNPPLRVRAKGPTYLMFPDLLDAYRREQSQRKIRHNQQFQMDEEAEFEDAALENSLQMLTYFEECILRDIPGVTTKEEARKLATESLRQFIRTSSGGDCFEAVQYIFGGNRLLCTPDSTHLLPLKVETGSGQVMGTCAMFYKLFDPDPQEESSAVELGVKVTYIKALNESAQVRMVCFNSGGPLDAEDLTKLRGVLVECKNRQHRWNEERLGSGSTP